MDIFNEYNVLVNQEIKDHIEKIYRDTWNFLKKYPDLTITELMLLQRHYVGEMNGIFSTIILKKQVELKKSKRSIINNDES